MQKITPFLWFDSNAEEAVNFYLSVFKNSKVVGTSRGESVECREVTNAASQHLAADGACMQQPITKNGLQK